MAGKTEFNAVEKGTAAELVILIQELAAANRDNALKHSQVVKHYDLCIEHLKE